MKPKNKKVQSESLDLGSFTPKFKKQDVKNKKNKKNQSENDDRFYSFKTFAKDVFNEPLTPSQYALWSPLFRPTMSLEQYRAQISQMDISMLSYKSLLTQPKTKRKKQEDAEDDVEEGVTHNGFLAIVDYGDCLEYMTTWQSEWLAKLGWTTNVTGYDINTVSFSSAELMESGIEWLKMLGKLSCRMLEFIPA
jgi:hypothetical protein